VLPVTGPYDMSVTLGDKRPSYSTVKNSVARFRTGHLSIEDEERSGRPTQVTISEKVDIINPIEEYLPKS
jgi:transposase